MSHISVMPDEVLKYLNVKPNGIYIDCTFGAGGHSAKIADNLSSEGFLLAIDWDASSQRNAIERFAGMKNFQFECGNFADVSSIAEKCVLRGVDGIVFDLGFSSEQTDDLKRGFSFRNDAPLDMRYNAFNPITAETVVNEYPEEYLSSILSEYAQEQFHRRIARSICYKRKDMRIVTTLQLSEIIKNATPGWYHHRKIHYATKTFQAVRMAVNHEIDNISKAIVSAIDLLSSGGRLAVISFHSVEHRMIKKIFAEARKKSQVKEAVKNRIFPSMEEVNLNSRARSAQLRVVEKV